MADDRAAPLAPLLVVMLAWLAMAMPASAAGAAAGERVLVFGFEITDTSGEGPRPDHASWLRAASELLASRLREAGLDASGPVDPVSGNVPLRSCNGCEAGIARQAGADIAATGTIHKVSTLILSINVTLRDADTGDAVSWTADIRGDNERSWLRGVDWLAEHRVLPYFDGSAVERGAGDPGP